MSFLDRWLPTPFKVTHVDKVGESCVLDGLWFKVGNRKVWVSKAELLVGSKQNTEATP